MSISELSKRLQQEAEETSVAAQRLIDSPTFASDPKLQAQAVIGGVKAGLFAVVAQLAAEMGNGSSEPTSGLTARLQAIQRENHALRISAAAAVGGNDGQFKRVVRSIVDTALRDAGIDPGEPGGSEPASVAAGGGIA